MRKYSWERSSDPHPGRLSPGRVHGSKPPANSTFPSCQNMNFTFALASIRNPSRLLAAGRALATPVFVRNQRRLVSHYNVNLAGLTEEQAEVRAASPLCNFELTPQRPCIPKFREAVHQFAEKEITPRAAEIDRTNTFPMVSPSSSSLARQSD